MCVCVSHFLYPCVDGYLACFRVLAIVNNAAMNMGVLISFVTVFPFPSDTYLEVELLDHIVVLFSIF